MYCELRNETNICFIRFTFSASWQGYGTGRKSRHKREGRHRGGRFYSPACRLRDPGTGRRLHPALLLPSSRALRHTSIRQGRLRGWCLPSNHAHLRRLPRRLRLCGRRRRPLQVRARRARAHNYSPGAWPCLGILRRRRLRRELPWNARPPRRLNLRVFRCPVPNPL